MNFRGGRERDGSGFEETVVRVNRVANVDTGTMDLEFQIDEGQKSYVEKIEIRGNLKTKDKVIRRELAISPGDVFDMVRVKISKERLDGLQYFDKVDLEPEPTDPPIAGATTGLPDLNPAIVSAVCAVR